MPGLKRPNQFRRKGRRLPGQSSDEDLGLERAITIKVYGDTAVINQSLVQIGDVSSGNYVEIGPNSIKIFNEGAVVDIWAEIDGNIVQTEFRVFGKDATDPDASIGMVATNYDSSAQNSLTLDTANDRALIDALHTVIGGALRFLTLTTTERDALSPTINGMMIYNSTTNKFQGYAAGAWVDLH